MNETAYLDWFIGNKRVMRHKTRPDHACMYFEAGECRKFNDKMYRIKSIKLFNNCVFDKNPYIKRCYLTEV